MAHLKFVSPAGWPFDRPVAVPVPVSSRGLVGNDRRAFLKQASHEFVAHIDRLREELGKHAGDYEPVHLIALGDDEAYSGNRNGDAFDAATNRARHHTFVKHARWYRNHKNKPGDVHYGVVKCSAHNEAMRRVELLPFLFRTKAAAERHGGQVADVELEKLAKGEDLDVSMACRVPYDKCAACGNEARTREEYCTDKTCPGGGCADNLAKVVKVGNDLVHMRVFNPGASFFDISKVHRRADRTAQAARADYLDKAASDGGFLGVGSWKAAEVLGVTAPPAVLDEAGDACAARVKLAYALAALEARGYRYPGDELLGFCKEGRDRALSAPRAGSLSGCLAALADRGAVLPLRDYAAAVGRAQEAEKAASELPGVFLRACLGGAAEGLAVSRRFDWPEHAGQYEREWAAKHAADYALTSEAVQRRSLLASLRGAEPEAAKAAADAGVGGLAAEYAAYQLAALERVARNDGDLALTAFFSLSQNRCL